MSAASSLSHTPTEGEHALKSPLRTTLRGLVALSLALTIGPLSAGVANAAPEPFVPAKITDLSLTPQQRAMATTGPYHFQFLHSRKCLANPAGSTANGTQMIQWTCANIDDQLWYLDWDVDGTSAHMRNKKSGKCLDLRGGVVANGTVIQQWTCGPTNPNQAFRFYELPDPYGFQIYTPLDYYHRHCVHQQGAVQTNNGKVTLWSCLGRETNTIFSYW